MKVSPMETKKIFVLLAIVTIVRAHFLQWMDNEAQRLASLPNPLERKLHSNIEGELFLGREDQDPATFVQNKLYLEPPETAKGYFETKEPNDRLSSHQKEFSSQNSLLLEHREGGNLFSEKKIPKYDITGSSECEQDSILVDESPLIELLDGKLLIKQDGGLSIQGSPSLGNQSFSLSKKDRDRIHGILSKYLGSDKHGQTTVPEDRLHAKNVPNDDTKLDEILKSIDVSIKYLDTNNKLKFEDPDSNKGSQKTKLESQSSFEISLKPQYGLTPIEIVETIENLLIHLNGDIIIMLDTQDDDETFQDNSRVHGLKQSSQANLSKLIESTLIFLKNLEDELNDDDLHELNEGVQNFKPNVEDTFGETSLIAGFRSWTTSETIETIGLLLDYLYDQILQQFTVFGGKSQNATSQDQSDVVQNSFDYTLDSIIGTINNLLENLDVKLNDEDEESEGDQNAHVDGHLSGEISPDTGLDLSLSEIIATTEDLVVFFCTDLVDWSIEFIKLGTKIVLQGQSDIAGGWLKAFSELINLIKRIQSLPENWELQLSGDSLDIGMNNNSDNPSDWASYDSLLSGSGSEHRRQAIITIKSLFRYLNSELFIRIVELDNFEDTLSQDVVDNWLDFGIELEIIVKTIEILLDDLKELDKDAQKILPEDIR